MLHQYKSPRDMCTMIETNPFFIMLAKFSLEALRKVAKAVRSLIVYYLGRTSRG
jgi:hypothetical protein